MICKCGQPIVPLKGYDNAEGKPDDLCWYCWRGIEVKGRGEEPDVRKRERAARRRRKGKRQD